MFEPTCGCTMGAGVNRLDGIIRSGSKNSGKFWKSSKFVYHTVEKAEF